MQENDKLSTKQIRALVVSTIVGIGILSLPNRVSLIQGNDGWISIILAGLLILPIIAVINKIFELYPNKNFYQIGNQVLGKWVFYIFLLVWLSYQISLISYLSRNLGELLKAFLLETTPTEVLIISFILTTSYMSRSEIQIIGRAAYHIYPIIVGFVILLILVSLTSVDFTNILPLFQSNMKNLPKSIATTFFSYIGYEILLFSIPFSEGKEKISNACMVGVGIVILIYIIVFLLTLSQYGIQSLQRQSFPTLSLIKEIDLPGFFIENLDGLVMAVWVLVIFSTMAPIYYSAGKTLSYLFRTKEHRLFILPLMPIIYKLSLYPQNMIELDELLGKFINYSGLVVVVLMPITIFCVGYFKTRRDKT